MNQHDNADDEIAKRLERVTKLRRGRLQWLLQHDYDLHQTSMAASIDMNPGELSQILKGNRAFGEKKARMIEVRLELQHLWLDGAELPTTDDKTIEEFSQIYRYSTADGRQLLLDMMKAVNKNFVPADKQLVMDAWDRHRICVGVG